MMMMIMMMGIWDWRSGSDGRGFFGFIFPSSN